MTNDKYIDCSHIRRSSFVIVVRRKAASSRGVSDAGTFRLQKAGAGARRAPIADSCLIRATTLEGRLIQVVSYRGRVVVACLWGIGGRGQGHDLTAGPAVLARTLGT